MAAQVFRHIYRYRNREQQRRVRVCLTAQRSFSYCGREVEVALMLCLAKRILSKQAQTQSRTPPVFSIGKAIGIIEYSSPGTMVPITTRSAAA